MLNFQN